MCLEKMDSYFFIKRPVEVMSGKTVVDCHIDN